MLRQFRGFKGKYANWLASDMKVRKLFVSLHYYLFRHRVWRQVESLDTKAKFTEIYRNNLWNNEESRSGGGSTMRKTIKMRKSLQDLFAEQGVQSICDAGCGDFNWMKAVQMNNIRYVGLDIVKDLIDANTKAYGNGNVSFLERDLINDDLPSADVILCRHVLFHLSFKDVSAALANFKKTKAKYLLTTTFPHLPENTDIPTGKCRSINFQIAPLNFPPPLRTIQEEWSDCLALWKLDDIHPEQFEI